MLEMTPSKTPVLPKFTSENLKNYGLKAGVLLGLISDIHSVLYVSADPVDVRNGSQQGTHPQAVSSSIFFV